MQALALLTKLFNNIIDAKKAPEDWRISTLVPIYKSKGEIQSSNYRGIKLMSETLRE